MRRRTKGTGTVSRRGTGFIARLVVGRKNGKAIYRTKSTRTRKQAQLALDSWLKNWPSSVEAERTTFEKYAEAWLASSKNANGNTRQLRYHALNHCIPVLGHLPLARIERIHIKQLLSNLEAAGVGSGMRSTVFVTLRTIFNDLIADEILTTSPVNRRDRPARIRNRDDGQGALSEEQVNALLGVAQNYPETYALYLIAVRLGLRQGELLALHCEDVRLDGDRPYLNVHRHLVRDANGVSIGPQTKTGGIRHVLLPQFLIQPLQDAIEARGGRGLLFPAPGGGIYEPKNFYNRNWRRHLREAGLPHFRFHQLRHTAATHALERNENPLAICQRLGWASTRMLFERYGHVTSRMREGAVEALERAYGNRTAQP